MFLLHGCLPTSHQFSNSLLDRTEKMSLTAQGRGHPAVFSLLGAVLLGGVGRSMRILVLISH